MRRDDKLAELSYSSKLFSMDTNYHSKDIYVINVYNRWGEVVESKDVEDRYSGLNDVEYQFDRLKDKYIFDYDHKLDLPLNPDEQQNNKSLKE